MRRIDENVPREAQEALSLLVDKSTGQDAYGAAFKRLGECLAERLPQSELGKKIMLVCTSEDADFLARGLFETLLKQQGSSAKQIAFACFWQKRYKGSSSSAHKNLYDVAPIVKRYEESVDGNLDSLIILKSIIAGSCVVRHAILDTVRRKQPKKVFVVAPVISKTAPASLKAEFPAAISKLFRFVYFAEDGPPDENGMVWPGIGGSVYERLPHSGEGLRVPAIVAERRREIAGVHAFASAAF